MAQVSDTVKARGFDAICEDILDWKTRTYLKNANFADVNEIEPFVTESNCPIDSDY